MKYFFILWVFKRNLTNSSVQTYLRCADARTLFVVVVVRLREPADGEEDGGGDQARGAQDHQRLRGHHCFVALFDEMKLMMSAQGRGSLFEEREMKDLYVGVMKGLLFADFF